MKPRIIVVDDDPVACKIMARMLRADYAVTAFEDSEAALRHFIESGAEILLTDLKIPGMDGLELLDRVKEIDPSVIVFVITGFSSVDTAVAAMKQGAYDYIAKPYDPDDVLIRVKRALKEKDLERRCHSYQQERRLEHDKYQIISQHPKMLQLLDVVKKVARTDSTVLVVGETGVGKELIVRKIHQWSGRGEFPFVAVNCSALSDGIMESELFGHEKGAFTGAAARKIGYFEMADKGTIFLDEIGTTDNRFQVKLLRVLQDRLLYRVGSPAAVKIDVRVIAATNQDLEQEARQNLFRSDLYYRLSVVTLQIPPLRERKTDIPLLADYFVRKYRQINPGVTAVAEQSLDLLARYDYPGNVRELENIIERAMILESGRELTPASLLIQGDKSLTEGGPGQDEASLPAQPFHIKAAEREHIMQVLRACKGKKIEAARMLGINKTTLWRKMKKYKLDRSHEAFED